LPNTNRARPAVVIALVVAVSETTAQELRLPPIVVTGTRTEQSAFDLPMSIDSVERGQIQDQRLQVNVSENLARIPGTVVQNRETYAQELQIGLRGFGARATFGVRGIKLIADDIPASAPDGQGGTALFSLSSADRIEVLRGPFSALYGNHSGGVVQVVTEDGPPQPTGTLSAALGSFDTRRHGAKFGGQAGEINYLFDISTFETDGYRAHSAARRAQLNSKVRWTPADGAKLTFVANTFDQPESQDPLGLTAAQLQQDRRQASPVALAFNTRRSLDNAQTGLVYERPLGGADTLRVLGYLGRRGNEQYLAIPLAVQSGPLHSGGVSSFERDFGGLGMRWTRRLSGATPTTLTAGIDYDRADDVRQGHLNVNGTKGDLKRHEQNDVDSRGVYLQAERWLTPDWSVSGGLRYTTVNFESDDRFITSSNPDDSGRADYHAWTPVAGVLYRINPGLNIYANAGRSFETPTFVELAYRPDDASGLNFDLQPTTSDHYELGLKAFAGTDTRVNLAIFAVDSRDEIVVFSSSGGRATFQNAPGSKREGAELALDSRFAAGITTYLSYTYLDAKFTDGFPTCAGTCASPNATVQAGNRIPGVPRYTMYGELGWAHRASGFSTAIEARWHGKVYVDDRNTEFAPSYVVANARAGFEQKVDNWRLRQFVRVDNLFNTAYVGAVIVNDANGRFYAPASARNYLIGAGVSRAF
jgi:iron complex outermembrane recepter protein